MMWPCAPHGTDEFYTSPMPSTIAAGPHDRPNGDIIVDAVTIDTDERDTPADTADTAVDAPADLLDEELLVEEVSIDGMCGVY